MPKPQGRFFGFFICAAVGAVAVVIFLPLLGNPPVGSYIAVLGLAAAAASFRPIPSKLEKSLWLLGLTTLAVLEIQNLYHDKSEHEAEFQRIAHGIDQTLETSEAHFKETMAQFDATRGQIAATMGGRKAVGNITEHGDATLGVGYADNARHIADVRWMSFIPDSSAITASKGSILWTIQYANFGSLTAQELRWHAAVIVGRRHDLAEQKRVVADFAAYSARMDVAERGTPSATEELMSHALGIGKFGHAFSGEEISSMQSGKDTLYVLWRFIWREPSGWWASDYCMELDDPVKDLRGAATACTVGVNDRYPYREHGE